MIINKINKIHISILNLTLLKIIFFKVGQNVHFTKQKICKNTYKSKRKMSFSNNDVIVTDNQIIANELNN